jgi:hypothetical protein
LATRLGAAFRALFFALVLTVLARFVAVFFVLFFATGAAFRAPALRPAAFRATTRVRRVPELLRAGFRRAVAAGLRLAIAVILSVRTDMNFRSNLP